MKTLVICDSLSGTGGAANVVRMVLLKTGWDVASTSVDIKRLREQGYKGNIYTIGSLTEKWHKGIHYFFEMPLRFFFSNKLRLLKKQYDIIIYFGNFSIFSREESEKSIWFCFSPNRIMYDLRAWKLSNSTGIKKLFFMLHVFLFKKIDEKKAAGFSTILTQSKECQKRIKKYYHREATVLFSPLDIKQYEFKNIGNFFLTVSRLMPEKRIDFVARVFVDMPHCNLVIVGDGPEQKKILSIIKEKKNIRYMGALADEDLRFLYATCKAVIYMPLNEDFGLVPLEANASGKVCIAVNEGGPRELIENGKTGFLIEPREEELSRKVKEINNRSLDRYVQACIQHARKYDVAIFVKQLKLTVH